MAGHGQRGAQPDPIRQNVTKRCAAAAAAAHRDFYGKGRIVNTNILTTLCAFLRTAPALRDITLAAEQLPPAPFTAGLWGRGTAVKATRQNLWGETRQSRRSEFLLRLCLPLPPGDDAAALQNVQRLETLQAAADSFMAANPKVKITIETFSWADFYTKWTTGLASGNVPDMSTALPNHVVEMIDAECILPMVSVMP